MSPVRILKKAEVDLLGPPAFGLEEEDSIGQPWLHPALLEFVPTVGKPVKEEPYLQSRAIQGERIVASPPPSREKKAHTLAQRKFAVGNSSPMQ